MVFALKMKQQSRFGSLGVFQLSFLSVQNILGKCFRSTNQCFINPRISPDSSLYLTPAEWGRTGFRHVENNAARNYHRCCRWNHVAHYGYRDCVPEQKEKATSWRSRSSTVRCHAEQCTVIELQCLVWNPSHADGGCFLAPQTIQPTEGVTSIRRVMGGRNILC